MGPCIATILVSFLMLWMLLDSMSVAQDTSAASDSGSTKPKAKIIKFDHDGDKKQEFTAYANFFNAEDVSFVARRPSNVCLDANPRINKVVLNFGDNDCNTVMMWGKSGFFWKNGDSELMSHLPNRARDMEDIPPKDVHVSLSDKNVYLIGDYNYRDDTEIFVCPVNQSITTIGFLFEKGPDEAIPKGCEITILLDDDGFVDEADIAAFTPPPTTTVLTTLPPTTTTLTTVLTTLPPTTTTLTTLPPTTTIITTLPPTTTFLSTLPSTVLSTTAITQNSRETKVKTTETSIATSKTKSPTLKSTKADTTIHYAENGTSKKSTPSAHSSSLPTKKATVIGVGSTNKIDNGAREDGPWAVIHIGLLLVIALY